MFLLGKRPRLPGGWANTKFSRGSDYRSFRSFRNPLATGLALLSLDRNVVGRMGCNNRGRKLEAPFAGFVSFGSSLDLDFSS
jgi:hypothetical protein